MELKLQFQGRYLLVSKLSPISRRKFIKRLKELGFVGPFSGGKHQFMTRSDLTLTIPNPHRKDISVALLSRILKQADITRKEWLLE